MSARRPPKLMRWLQILGRCYDHGLGWVLGHRFLRLSHTGRRSGRRYQTMLEVIGIDRETGELFVLAGLGSTSDWYRNVFAAEHAEIAIGSSEFAAKPRVLDTEQATEAITDYERRNRLLTPFVRRGLSWVIGWPYDGSKRTRNRLVRECPIVAFQPIRS